MRRFKPFTPNYEKKAKRVDYWYSMMSELAYINWLTVDLKEKYWRMDATLSGNASELLEETMEDYEALSEESCMYCNRHCKQYWTHEDSQNYLCERIMSNNLRTDTLNINQIYLSNLYCLKLDYIFVVYDVISFIYLIYKRWRNY